MFVGALIEVSIAVVIVVEDVPHLDNLRSGVLIFSPIQSGLFFSFVVLLFHALHCHVDKSLSSGFHGGLLQVLQVFLHFPVELVHFISMSLLEALDGGSNDPEDWQEDVLVDDIGAHHRS